MGVWGCSESHGPASDADADADVDADGDTDADGDGDSDGEQRNACGDACPDSACCSVTDGLNSIPYCADITMDSMNCGGCGQSCGIEQLCENSTCVCWQGSICGERCVDFETDPTSCGTCGTVCPGDRPACSGGVCVPCAEAGLLDCAGACVRGDVDDQNCGLCGNVCGPNTQCVAGTCVAGECDDVDCTSGSACCDHVWGGTRGCADLRSDTSNCGACGVRCLQGDTCVDGGCGCPPWATVCDGDCVDLGSDPSNCGACGTRCSREEPLCLTGVCTGCEVWDATACGGVCVYTDWDPLHCGACNAACAADEYCTEGECVRLTQ